LPLLLQPLSGSDCR